jgi:hypothetical protein
MISKLFTQIYKYYSNETAFNRASTLSEIQQMEEQVVAKSLTNEVSPDKSQEAILDIFAQISKEASMQLHQNNQSENAISHLQENKDGAKAFLEQSQPLHPGVIGAVLKNPNQVIGTELPQDSRFTETIDNINKGEGIESVNSYDPSKFGEQPVTNTKGEKAIDSIIKSEDLTVKTNVEVGKDTIVVEKTLDPRTAAHVTNLEKHLSHPIHGESVSRMIDLLKGTKNESKIKQITETSAPKNLEYNFTLVAENLERAGLSKEKSESLSLLTKELFGGLDNKGIQLNLKTTSQLIDILYLDSSSRKSIFAKSGASIEKVKLYSELCDKLTSQDISTLRYVFAETEKGNFIPKFEEQQTSQQKNFVPFNRKVQPELAGK